MQRTFSLAALSLAAVVLLAGCGSDDDHDSSSVAPSTPTVGLRIVHAAIDAPDVSAFGGQAFSVDNVTFGKASPSIQVPATGLGLAVNAKLPGNTTTAVLTPSLAFMAGQDYSLYAVGKVADGTLAGLLVNRPQGTPIAGNARLQVVHAAAGAPTVDVHVTAPDATLSSSTVTATLPFRQFTGVLSVPSGNYRVRLTPAGQPGTVAFDSGAIAVPAGADWQIAAIDNRFAGSSPVSLVAVTPDGSTVDIRDAGSTAAIRVVHAVADAPAVDVLLNNSVKAVTGLKFPEFTGYAGLTPGSYNVKVAANADNSVVVINADLNLSAGSYSTVLATGSLSAGTIKPWVLADTPRRVATEAKVRIAHASTVAGNVDIYVTASSNISTSTPAFSNVPFMAETGYVSLLPGSYVVTVTPTGSKTAAIGPVALTLQGNKIYTAVARDGIAGAQPGLILLDDFNAG